VLKSSYIWLFLHSPSLYYQERESELNFKYCSIIPRFTTHTQHAHTHAVGDHTVWLGLGPVVSACMWLDKQTYNALQCIHTPYTGTCVCIRVCVVAQKEGRSMVVPHKYHANHPRVTKPEEAGAVKTETSFIICNTYTHTLQWYATYLEVSFVFTASLLSLCCRSASTKKHKLYTNNCHALFLTHTHT
jgi:hypothetical protein